MSQVQLKITPLDQLIDVPRNILVTGLQPEQVVNIQTETLRGNGVKWKSEAQFKANHQGVINLCEQAPLKGSYSGIEPMGLIWSQLPEHQKERELFPSNLYEPLKTKITVTGISGENLKAVPRDSLEINDESLKLEEYFIQRLVLEDVQRIEVREQGLVGTLYLPATKGPHPAVMILNGSGGGINEPRAALYASHGYIAFALAYFKAPGLSDYISNTPLEYFKKGLDWLRETYHPLNDFVALNGQSRGGELVLLLASLFPESVSAVIAYVPGAVVHCAQNAADPDIGREGATWLLNGQPIPHIWENNRTASWIPFDEGPPPHRHEKAITTALNDSDAIERARIRVEHIKAPIILLSASDDGAWPSSRYSQMIVERLNDFDFPYDLRWIDTRDGGHGIVFPYIPTTQIIYKHPISGKISTNGGKPSANAHSNERSWNEIKDFLRAAVDHSLEDI